MDNFMWLIRTINEAIYLRKRISSFYDINKNRSIIMLLMYLITIKPSLIFIF